MGWFAPQYTVLCPMAIHHPAHSFGAGRHALGSLPLRVESFSSVHVIEAGLRCGAQQNSEQSLGHPAGITGMAAAIVDPTDRPCRSCCFFPAWLASSVLFFRFFPSARREILC